MRVLRNVAVQRSRYDAGSIGTETNGPIVTSTCDPAMTGVPRFTPPGWLTTAALTIASFG